MSTKPQVYEISAEEAGDRLFDIFAEHLDALPPEVRREVLHDLSETARQLDAKSNTSA